MAERIRVDVTPPEHVTAIVYSAAARDHAGISLLLAHGAGANQISSFMVHFATALAARGIDTVTFSVQQRSQTRSGPERQAGSVLAEGECRTFTGNPAPSP